MKHSVLSITLLISPSWLSASEAKIRDGEYLSEKYIAAVTATKSARKAFKLGDLPMYIVRTEGVNKVFSLVTNFHEGAAEFALKPNGEVFVSPGSGYESSGKPELKIVDAEHLVTTWPGSAPSRYRYVDSAEKWVTNQMLKGTYRDKNGRTVAFYRDGRTNLFGKEVSCSMGLDFVREEAVDYMMCGEVSYGVRIEEGTLALFRSEPARFSYAAKPFFIGRRVSS